jgi:hypothetical protein
MASYPLLDALAVTRRTTADPSASRQDDSAWVAFEEE